MPDSSGSLGVSGKWLRFSAKGCHFFFNIYFVMRFYRGGNLRGLNSSCIVVVSQSNTAQFPALKTLCDDPPCQGDHHV